MLRCLLHCLLRCLLPCLLLSPAALIAQPLPHVVFIAGSPSHGYGEHEHSAGGKLLVQDLNASGLVRATLYTGGWPEHGIDKDAASVVMYLDGDGGHDSLPHLEELAALMARGVGLVALHFATHLPQEVGQAQYLGWLGGYYNSDTSTNPHWRGDFRPLQGHPVTRGVAPFTALDEFYFNMRFTESGGLSRLLVGTPPDHAREHVPHPRRRFYLFGGSVPDEVASARGREETVAWAFERDNGGRAFGFTGGHFHWNWGRADFRRLVLNAIAWTAGADIPAQGLQASALPLATLIDAIGEEPPARFSPVDITARFGLDTTP